MATTISSGTLTVTVTESISLNGSTMDASNVLTVGSITEISQRIVSIDATNIRTLFEFGTVVGSGKFVLANVQYIRITNKDDTNTVDINVASAASNNWTVVSAGQSFMMSAQDGLQGVASGTVVVPVMADLVSISGYSANAIDLDCYIATT